MNCLPTPGAVLHHDYRTGKLLHNRAGIRLVQWNIERGYELDAVIEQLKEIDADILSLQEVDIGCERSEKLDTGALIAHALNYNYLFICEFEELFSPVRDARTQGGGVHGNAILTKFDIAGWEVVEHSRHPVDWDDPSHPLALKEPRKGRRLTLAADIATPLGDIRLYNCHLEVFCGMLDRMWQFSDILAHCKRKESQPLACSPKQHHGGREQQQQQEERPPRLQAILGDLNTMANGIARCSPNYCCDAMRWRTLGISEAAFWQKHIFSHIIAPCDLPDPRSKAVPDPGSADGSEGSSGVPEGVEAGPGLLPINQALFQWGLPQQVCERLLNPGFYDPFDVDQDVTLDNPTYRLGKWSLMKGKLDWVLLRGLKVVKKGMGNDHYAASDHKWLMVDVLPASTLSPRK